MKKQKVALKDIRPQHMTDKQMRKARILLTKENDLEIKLENVRAEINQLHAEVYAQVNSAA